MSIPFTLHVKKQNTTILNKVVLCNEDDFLLNLASKNSGVSGEWSKVYAGNVNIGDDIKKMVLIDDSKVTIAHVKIILPNFSQVVVIDISPIIENDQTLPKRNALDILMQTSRTKKQLPPPKKVYNGKDKLYNRVIEYLENEGAGFSVNCGKDMNEIVDTIVSVLWKIDGHHGTIESASGVNKIPSAFNFGEVFHKLFYNEQRKKKLPSLNQLVLISAVEALEKIYSNRHINTQIWDTVRKHLNDLTVVLHQYVHYLQDAATRNEERRNETNHNRKTYIMNTSDHTLQDIIYKPLCETLASVDYYVPLNVALFAPIEKRSKYKYIQGIKMPFRTQIYRCYAPIATFIWKILEDDQDDNSASSSTIAYLEAYMDEIVLEDKQSLAAKHFDGITKWSSSVLQQTKDLLTGK